MPVVRKDLYLLHRSTTNEIGHHPIPEQPGLDGAKGVQAESNSYTAKVPCCRELLLSGFTYYSKTLPSSA